MEPGDRFEKKLRPGVQTGERRGGLSNREGNRALRLKEGEGELGKESFKRGKNRKTHKGKAALPKDWRCGGIVAGAGDEDPEGCSTATVLDNQGATRLRNLGGK